MQRSLSLSPEPRELEETEPEPVPTGAAVVFLWIGVVLATFSVGRFNFSRRRGRSTVAGEVFSLMELGEDSSVIRLDNNHVTEASLTYGET